MSRTIRKSRRTFSRWYGVTPEPKGDSKPFALRNVTKIESKQPWHCRCDYCIDGKLHKNQRRGCLLLDELKIMNDDEESMRS